MGIIFLNFYGLSMFVFDKKNKRPCLSTVYLIKFLPCLKFLLKRLKGNDDPRKKMFAMSVRSLKRKSFENF